MKFGLAEILMIVPGLIGFGIAGYLIFLLIKALKVYIKKNS